MQIDKIGLLVFVLILVFFCPLFLMGGFSMFDDFSNRAAERDRAAADLERARAYRDQLRYESNLETLRESNEHRETRQTESNEHRETTQAENNAHREFMYTSMVTSLAAFSAQGQCILMLVAVFGACAVGFVLIRLLSRFEVF